ncbi:myomegalin-like isoform X6 [Tachysurus ichikawai]
MQDSGVPAKPPLMLSDRITAESLTNNNEAELQRRCDARQQEIDHMQQVLQTKIQLLQEVDTHSHVCSL